MTIYLLTKHFTDKQNIVTLCPDGYRDAGDNDHIL
ncbi:uncharacterized protein METZ01_LOCUS256677, partial [marine metagenome]